MARVTPQDVAADKWQRRAAVSTPDYEAGIRAPRSSWQSASSAADANYKAAVTAAANGGRYLKGIKATSDASWQSKALAKGPARYAEGVAVGVDDWIRGFGPYHAAISSLSLPARGPKGSPQNLQRVAAVATTLRQVKERAA